MSSAAYLAESSMFPIKDSNCSAVPFSFDEAWFIVRNTPGVTGFIGSSGKGAKPFPLTPQEADKILNQMGMSRLEVNTDLNVDDTVKVIGGPFAGMYGKIKNIDSTTGLLEVSLDLFGQETNVELELSQIEKS